MTPELEPKNDFSAAELQHVLGTTLEESERLLQLHEQLLITDPEYRRIFNEMEDRETKLVLVESCIDYLKMYKEFLEKRRKER